MLLPDEHYWINNLGNYDSSKLVVEYNNFYTNEVAIKLGLGDIRQDVSVLNNYNYWNTDSETEIEQMIIDGNDDSTVNLKLNIIPYLFSPFIESN